MSDRRPDSDSYDGEVREASVAIHGKKIDSKTAQMLSSSGRAAKEHRMENKTDKLVREAFEKQTPLGPKQGGGKEGDRQGG